MIKAQTLPNGPIRIVVGFPPGGGTDALARVVGQKLSVMWNTSIVIDNKGGAAGVIAADYVAKQASDGNTLLMAHINSHALAPSLQPKLGYVVERDFVPIALVGVTQYVVGGGDLFELVFLARIGVGMQLFGEFAVGASDLFISG
jgi:tripartite-type tricarboxylate transporter receptor subunit TctC